MFRKSQGNDVSEPEVRGRYVVETYAPFGGPMKHHEKYAAELEAMLNSGEDRGWTLIAIESGPAVGLKMLVWDTQSD